MKKHVFYLLVLLIISPVFAQTDKDSLKTVNENIASAFKKQEYDEAIKFAQQAVELNQKIYGIDDRQTAIAFENLGLIYREDKQYKLSSENLQKAIKIYQKDSKQNGKDLVNAYESLAFSQVLDKSLTEAEQSYLKALEVAEAIFGRESKESFQPILSLADFYARMENVEKRLDHYLKSYVIAMQHFGKESNEFEKVSIHQRYYSVGKSGVEENKQKDFNKKLSELRGYEIGEATSLPIPPYPKIARTANKKGKIIVKVWINEKGGVTEAKAVFGEMFFAPIAEDAAKRAKFKPTVQNGKPINVVNYLAYSFLL